jgi:hypothetical protein
VVLGAVVTQLVTHRRAGAARKLASTLSRALVPNCVRRPIVSANRGYWARTEDDIPLAYAPLDAIATVGVRVADRLGEHATAVVAKVVPGRYPEVTPSAM